MIADQLHFIAGFLADDIIFIQNPIIQSFPCIKFSNDMPE